ncbi:MAG: hypothetical protein LBF70_01240 [Holosporales bacterium]|nr:hypothetical protein [Holosporales bacterium]
MKTVYINFKYIIFAEFSPSVVVARINDCNSNFIISVDAYCRGGKVIHMKHNIDSIRKICQKDIRALIIRRQGIDISWNEDLDFDYHKETVDQPTDCEIVDTTSLSKLFILYTSGSVG